MAFSSLNHLIISEKKNQEWLILIKRHSWGRCLKNEVYNMYSAAVGFYEQLRLEHGVVVRVNEH